MAEKKKRQIFTEDLSVFSSESKGLEEDKPKVKRVKSSKPTARDLEKALETLKALGFSVNIPTSQEEIIKHDVSVEKLGFSKVERSVKEITTKVKVLKATLGSQHTIGGTSYGPGEITLNEDQASLLRHLIHQDNLARSSYLDTAQYNPVSRCFIIKPGNSSDRFHKYSKREVSESQFNSDSLWEEATITTNKHDIAGYNPNFNSENKSF